MKLSGQLIKLYILTVIFFSLLLNEILTAFRSLARSIGLGRTAVPAPIVSNLFAAMVNESLPVVRFGDGREAWPAECAVCICRFKGDEEVRELQCGHVFHRDCLDTWLEHQGHTCPLCRSSMLSEAAMMERWRREQEMRGDDLVAPWLLSFHGSHFHWPIWAV
ncbi:hypothetical protein ACLOJK_016122 [Asimina triloba]